VDKSLIIGSFARHILTTLGGMAVAKGWLDSSQIEPVAGAMLVIAGVVWSLVQKRTAK
jgi:hypothetical protein